VFGRLTKLLVFLKRARKKNRHKNSEASLAAGLAPEFRRTRGDKNHKVRLRFTRFGLAKYQYYFRAIC
jgi:hypothetical protein